MDRIGDITAFKEKTLIVKGADLFTTKGFTAVPNFILKSKALSVGAKLTYAMLLQYAREENECFPGQDRLAEDLGSTDRSVRTWLKELKAARLVTSKQRGQGKSNIYTVHLKPPFWRNVR
jgi:hypothetical protein